MSDDIRITELSVRVHIPGDSFGFRGNVTIERTAALSEPVSVSEAAAVEKDLVDSISTEVIDALQETAAKVAAVAKDLPKQAVPGFTQAAQVAAVQPQPVTATANTGTPEGVAALVNGGAVADSGIVEVQGRYGPLVFPHPDALSTNALKEGVFQLLTQLEVHPSQVVVFDNRTDIIAGNDRSGHMGVVKVARAGSPAAQAAMGPRAIAWVDFRGGRVSLSPTKDFKALGLSVRAELAQPSAGSPF